MKIQRSVYALAAAALAGSALCMSSAAQARDVAWSIGVASPGLQIGVSNAPHVVYRQPVYVPQTVYYGQPQVVYPQPQVSYVQQQMVYAPQPYYVQSVVVPPIYYRDYRRGGPYHHWHNGRWDYDRRR